MTINTRIHEKRFAILDRDVNSGKVQSAIDNGWTTLQLAKKYEVSETTIKRLAREKRINFKENRNRGRKADDVELSEIMTPAKRLAMSAKW